MAKKNWKEVTLRGYKAFVSEMREKRLKKNWHYYEIRHEENKWNLPVSIEKGVMVNFFGTIAFEKKIQMGKEKKLTLTEEEKSLLTECF